MRLRFRHSRLHIRPHQYAGVALLALLLAACRGSDDYATQMAKQHAGEKPTATPIAAPEPVESRLVQKSVTYGTIDGLPLTGYLSRLPDAQGAPGILLIHEWWGLNQNIRALADRYAALGYQALAVDLYGGQVAESPEEAKALVGEVLENLNRASANLRQAYAFLAEERQAARVGVIGWCFGGGWSLETALMLPQKIDAAVIYYGRLVTDPEQLARLEMPILAFFGAKDESIPESKIEAFRSALEKLGKQIEIHVYPQAGHAFANPSGEHYVASAALDSWQRTVEFFVRTLQPASSPDEQ